MTPKTHTHMLVLSGLAVYIPADNLCERLHSKS